MWERDWYNGSRVMFWYFIAGHCLLRCDMSCIQYSPSTKFVFFWVYFKREDYFELLLFSHPIMSNSLWPHGLQHFRPLYPLPSSEICPSSCPLHQWCHLLMPSFPSALNLSQHQGLFQQVSCSHQVTKILELQLQHQSFQWVFRADFLVWFPCCPGD